MVETLKPHILANTARRPQPSAQCRERAKPNGDLLDRLVLACVVTLLFSCPMLGQCEAAKSALKADEIPTFPKMLDTNTDCPAQADPELFALIKNQLILQIENNNDVDIKNIAELLDNLHNAYEGASKDHKNLTIRESTIRIIEGPMRSSLEKHGIKPAPLLQNSDDNDYQIAFATTLASIKNAAQIIEQNKKLSEAVKAIKNDINQNMLIFAILSSLILLALSIIGHKNLKSQRHEIDQLKDLFRTTQDQVNNIDRSLGSPSRRATGENDLIEATIDNLVTKSSGNALVGFKSLIVYVCNSMSAPPKQVEQVSNPTSKCASEAQDNPSAAEITALDLPETEAAPVPVDSETPGRAAVSIDAEVAALDKTVEGSATEQEKPHDDCQDDGYSTLSLTDAKIVEHLCKSELELLDEMWKRYFENSKPTIDFIKHFPPKDEIQIARRRLLLSDLPRAIAEFQDLATPCETVLIQIRDVDYLASTIPLIQPFLTDHSRRPGDKIKELSLIRKYSTLLSVLQSSDRSNNRLGFDWNYWITDRFRLFADLFLRKYQQAKVSGTSASLEEGLKIVRKVLGWADEEPIDIELGKTLFNSRQHVGRSTSNKPEYADGVITEVVRNGFKKIGGEIIKQPEVIVNRR